MTFEHGGNIYEIARRLSCRPSDIIDLSNNINPLGPPAGLLDFLKDSISKITRLPEIDSRDAIINFAAYLAIDPDRLLAGNGTTQFIYSIPRALEIKNSIIVGPTYSDYQDALNRRGIPSKILLSDEADAFQPDLERISRHLNHGDTAYLCNPNNPTGALIPHGRLHQFCESHPKVKFIIDESYLPFVTDGEKKSMIYSELSNVMVLLSISKIFGIPGLRIGFIIGNGDDLVKINRQQLPWNVNSLAQDAVRYLVDHKSLIAAFIEQTRIFCREQRRRFHAKLNTASQLTLFPGQTPFILIKLPNGLTAFDVRQHLARKMILIRNCENFRGLSDQFIRISLKTPEANRLIAAILKTQVSRVTRHSEEGRIAC